MSLDCTIPEIADKVCIQNMLDQMHWSRHLAFAVLIKEKYTDKHRLMQHGEDDDEDSDCDEEKGITLKSCFEAARNTDLLTGDNQYYCKKCKTHTDSHK